MSTAKNLFIFSIGALLVFTVFVYHYRDQLYAQYEKVALNAEFACPENQTSQGYDSYLYRYIEFYKTYYPKMKMSELLNMRYKQLVDHNCIQTLANIAHSDASTATSSDSADPTLGNL